MGSMITKPCGGRWPGAPAERPFVGRGDERRLLDGLVESVEGGGAAALVAGEAGIGKTALLTQVAEMVSHRAGMRVLSARGVESEAVLAFAAIADLLLPLRERFVELPQAQRQALEVCLALADGATAGPLAACAGALGVLGSAADNTPLAILVDDFQWVDPESQQILLFVARRLETEPIVMFLAVRDEPGAQVPEHGLPVLRMSGLSLAECADLARGLGADISPSALQCLVGRTGGNPLAMLENLAGAVDSVDFLESGPLALGASLERAWGRVFEELPEDTQHALFVVATDGVSGGRHIAAALDTLRLSLGSLAAAERRGLVHTEGGEIQLRHPLMRPVVVSHTPLWMRTAACRALAAAAEGHVRAWYLAAAATSTDDAAAEALVAAAEHARQRNGYSASARAWRRAAELTADQNTRVVRLVHAATDAHLAGDLGAAAAWCEEALEQSHDPLLTAEAELLLGRARTWQGDPLRGFNGLVRAAAVIRPVKPERTVTLLAEALWPAAMAGRIRLMRQVARQIEQLLEEMRSAPGGEDASLTVLAMVAQAFVMSAELDRAARYRQRAQALLPSADPVTEQRGVAYLAQGDIWTEGYEQGRQRLGAVVECGRRMGAPMILSLALGLSSELGWWTGEWAPAYADATDSLQWAQELNQTGLIGYSLSLLARIEAARGDRQECETHVERARTDIEPRGMGCQAIYNAAALGLCALTDGELAAAIEHLESAWALTQAAELGNPDIIPFAGDLAEALARSGAADRAEQVVAWLQERADSTGLAYPRAAAARTKGILAPNPADAEAWFAQANSVHQKRPMPFEQARTLLCEGEALRRARRPAAARPPLRHALALFRGLGARPWAARAISELAATGAHIGTRTPTSQPGLGALSPQELQVARAIGRGLNNAEAAAALFVSRKTVEAHLTRAYRKLGIRSRTELTRLLLTGDQTS